VATDIDAAGLLRLHLDALLAFRSGDLSSGASLLTDAAAAEQTLGCKAGHLHTLHQSRLLTHLNGDWRRATQYYTDTYRTVSSFKNREGAGLCLRSLGELSLASGNTKAAMTFWRRGMESLRAANLPEADVVAAWLATIEQT
jgi:hypothetical protein